MESTTTGLHEFDRERLDRNWYVLPMALLATSVAFFAQF